MASARKKKSKEFYDQQTKQSRVKAEIITKYAASRATIIASSGAKKVAHIDLWAGRGRYKNGPESTPLMVLRKTIDDPVARESLVSIFNDKDHADVLQAEISALPGIKSLRYEPVVQGFEVGARTPEIFERIRLVPTLAFLDPWGYKGLTRELIRSMLKDWGCEVMFFFNYNRVNMDITNPLVANHMEALFGAARLATLQLTVGELSGEPRERAVMAALMEMVREVGGQFVLPFRFAMDGAKRTSHYLVFVSKHFLGCKIMRDVMAKASSYAIDEVPSFEYTSSSERPLFLADGRSVGALAESLAVDLAGRIVPMKLVFEDHGGDKLYVRRNYVDAIERLEAAERVILSRRPQREGTLADDIAITFLRVPGSGTKIEASRSTPARPASDLQPSASARPTA